MKARRAARRCRVRRGDAAAAGVIALFFALFFARVFAGQRFIITGDAFYYTYPLRTVAWDMLRQGVLPLWTPLMLSGYPLLSVALLAPAYPLTWGHLFLPGHWAEQLYALAPFLLSPLTTYAYVRGLGRSRLAALLAGLSFGYGGMMCGILANSGMLTNGLVWAPLVLLFIDRARTRPLAPCLFWAAAAYALSVLAGHGQSYVYAGALAVAYGLFTSLSLVWAARRRADAGGVRGALRESAHWRPLATAVGAVLLAAGVAAFQLFETAQAARLSVRSRLTYEVFGEGSFTLREALLSLGAQLYHYVDTGTYVPPLALALALLAACGALGGRARDARVLFWVAVALAAFVLLLGANTPLYRLVFRVPVVNKFRVPSRHTFEWTLALSVLAAYGWDWAARYCRRVRRERTRATRDAVVACALLAAAAAVGVLWWRAVVQGPGPSPAIFTALPERSYWLWKLAFSASVCALAWFGFRLPARRARAGVLAAAIALGCFVEANAAASCWWAGFASLPAARFAAAVPDTARYLRQFPPAEGRVYTRVGMFSEEFTTRPRLDAPNLTVLRGLHDVAGMEPLILSRYSRALGDVGPDSVTPRAGGLPDDELFAARSHVLDLLNTTHVVTYAGTLGLYEEVLVPHEGVGFSARELSLYLPPGAKVTLGGAGARGDTLALVTSLGNSVPVEQGAPVARVRVRTADGETIELELRAGRDTAEWAHERADVRAGVRHELAPVFDRRPGDAEASYEALRYWARPGLGREVTVEGVEIENVSPSATVTVWKASVFAAAGGRPATPLAPAVRSENWAAVYDRDGVQILRNARALPRAWLVAEAEAVDEEEALARVRGVSERAFDPRRTVLLEVGADELPALPGGPLAPGSAARVVSYEPNRLVVETEAATATVLVVSEMFYPGWRATVDGAPARIDIADYLLRGVALPAGRHTVEMRYAAPAARGGALVSAGTLLVLAALALRARRQRTSRLATPADVAA